MTLESHLAGRYLDELEARIMTRVEERIATISVAGTHTHDFPALDSEAIRSIIREELETLLLAHEEAEETQENREEQQEEERHEETQERLDEIEEQIEELQEQSQEEQKTESEQEQETVEENHHEAVPPNRASLWHRPLFGTRQV